MTATDHDVMAHRFDRRRARPVVLCENDEQPAVYLTLWTRPFPRMCACDVCSTTPACAETVALWRRRYPDRLRSVVTMPEGWLPGDGWPVRDACRCVSASGILLSSACGVHGDLSSTPEEVAAAAALIRDLSREVGS